MITTATKTYMHSIPQNASESESESESNSNSNSNPNHDCNTQQHQSPKSYLLIENPKKSNNLGPILRCAAAYAIHQVIFVGYQKCSIHGSHGASKHLNIISFPTFSQAITYLRKDCNVPSIIGIMGGGSGDAFYNHDGVVLNEWQEENVFILNSNTINNSNDIDTSTSQTQKYLSYPIHIRPFLQTKYQKYNHTNEKEEFRQIQNGNFCFVISKHPKGFPCSHKNICDSFVHIPYVDIQCKINQHENTSSSSRTTIPMQNESSLSKEVMDSYIPPYRYIDVQSCLSIVLHHFTSWMQEKEKQHRFNNSFHERSFEQYKFKVDPANERYQTLQNIRERDSKDRSKKRKQEKLDAEYAVEDALYSMADLGL